MKTQRTLLFLILLFVGMSSTWSQTSDYFNGFESTVGAGDWETVVIQSDGTNGVPAADGSFYGDVGTQFTRFGGYNSTFPDFGYSTSLDVYLDVDGGYANDTRFDYSSAISGTDGNHERDFIFNGGFYNDATPVGTASANRFIFSASNNSVGNPPGGTDPIAIETTGWYTLEHVFYDDGTGVLAVDFNIYDDSGTLLASWTRSNPLDVIGGTVGGNRYGWFPHNSFGTLPIDNSSLTVTLGPVVVYDADPSLSGTNVVSSHSTIQEAIDAVTTLDGYFITVDDGTYVLSSTLVVNKEVTIDGESESGVILDASAMTPITQRVIETDADNITLKDMTIKPITDPDGSSNNNIGFTIKAGSNSAPTINDGLTLENITIDGAAERTPFDIHGIDNVDLINLSASNTTRGNGINITGCTNVNIDGFTGTNNAWGSIAIYTSRFVPAAGRGSDNVTIVGANLSIDGAVFSQDDSVDGLGNPLGNPLFNTNISVTGWDYNVFNDDHRGALNDGPEYTYFAETEAVATTVAEGLNDATMPANTASAIQQVSTGEWFVTNANLSIQAAIDEASDGDVINVLADTYNITSTIVVDKEVSIEGPQKDVDPRTAAMARTPGSMSEAIVDGGGTDGLFSIEASNVTLNGIEITNGDGDLISSPSSPAWSNVQVKYCIIHEANDDEGIQLRNVDNGMVAYNYLYDIAEDGINMCCGSANSTIQYNEITTSNSQNSVIYLYDIGTGMEVSNNLLYDNTNNDGIKIGIDNGGDASDNSMATISNNTITNQPQDGISVYTGGVTVSGNTITGSNSANGAIYLAYAISDVSITGNEIYDNTTNAVRLNTDVDATTVTINENSIYNNDTGVQNDAAGTVDATCNWWGQASGPQAGATSGDVLVDPWLVDSDITNPDCSGTCSTTKPTNQFTDNIMSNSAELNWDAVPGADEYLLFVGGDIQGFFTSATNSLTLTGLTPGTSYHWNVRAVCVVGNKSPWASNVSFTTIGGCSTVNPVTNQSTSNIMANSAQLNWDMTGNADEYLIFVGGDIQGFFTSTTNSLTLNSLTPGTLYHWNVRVVCDNGSKSAWANNVVFTTTGTGSCSPANPVTNQFTSGVTSNSAQLNWDMTGNADEYLIFVGGDIQGFFTSTTNSLNLTGLTPGTLYHWNVRVVCDNGPNSAWANDVVFTTDGMSPLIAPPTNTIQYTSAREAYEALMNGGSPVVEQRSSHPAVNDRKNLSVNVFPNPAQDFVNIQMGGDELINHVSLFDLSGKLIQTMEGLQANQYELRFAYPLARGMYMLRIGSDERVITKRLVIK